MGNIVSTPPGLWRSAKTKTVLTFEDYTVDAPDDNQIRKGVESLKTAIIDHARDYYDQLSSPRSPTSIEEVLCGEKEWFPTLSTIEFSHLLCDVRTRRSAITCFISHMVLKNIDFYGSK